MFRSLLLPRGKRTAGVRELACLGAWKRAGLRRVVLAGEPAEAEKRRAAETLRTAGLEVVWVDRNEQALDVDGVLMSRHGRRWPGHRSGLPAVVLADAVAGLDEASCSAACARMFSSVLIVSGIDGGSPEWFDLVERAAMATERVHLALVEGEAAVRPPLSLVFAPAPDPEARELTRIAAMVSERFGRRISISFHGAEADLLERLVEAHRPTMLVLSASTVARGRLRSTSQPTPAIVMLPAARGSARAPLAAFM